jgi:glycosyltransferase involved in cell wall biosynthesis
MAGAPIGGAELFFERLCLAQHADGDDVLALIRTDAARASRLAALPVEQFEFGGILDFTTKRRLGVSLRRFAPRVAVAWMNRAARLAPRGDWVLAGRLGGFYDLDYYRNCDHLIGNTRAIVDYIGEQGWPAQRIHYLPNFAPDLAGAPPAFMPGPNTVLALGRLHANKGFDVLIRAMPLLPGVHALIAGEGPERNALTALASREGVASRVHMPGWTQDTAGLLAACSALVCPSRHEPLGNVVLEAWSASRPVVAAAASGPRELIMPGEDGLLVPCDDPAALAQSLALVLGHLPLAQRLAEAGRARYESDFAAAPVLRSWRDFLATVEKA